MMKKYRRITVACLNAALLLAGSVSAQKKGSTSGPSSSESPYVVRSIAGIVTKSILTVGDSVNLKPDGVTPYRMVGIPDGLGAFDNGDGTFTVLMNHELGGTSGIVRAHGAGGAFVSRWIIRKDDLTVLHGEDLIRQVALWNTATDSYNAPAMGVSFSRFCSADLALKPAFYNAATGLGYDDYIFMNGEENGATGRAFAHLLNGTSYELPRLGKFSWENSVPNPSAGNKTVVAGTDDSTPGQVYIYVGEKTDSGSAIDKAGLTNGNLYGVKVTGITTESRELGIPSGTPFSLYNLGNVADKTGMQIQGESVMGGVTEFLRPEDGAWDPNNPNDFYFVTTDRFDTVKAGTGSTIARSRLYRLRFNDIMNPTLGGMIDTLLDGTEDQQMMDNITVGNRGQILIQEDVGNNAHLGKIWRYSIENDTLNPLAEHDPNRFLSGSSNFVTQDEEASGIIDVSSILGDGWFLLVVQAHHNLGDSELVEGGQLLALHYPPGKK